MAACLSARLTGCRGAQEPVPEGASGYCECTDGAHVAEQNCDHGTFSCIDECKGITHKQDEILLTEYDMGRRDQRRAVDKLHRCVLNRRTLALAPALVQAKKGARCWQPILRDEAYFGCVWLAVVLADGCSYVTDLRINTVDVEFSVGWTWTGLIIFLVALIASFVLCCVGELVNEQHDHQY